MQPLRHSDAEAVSGHKRTQPRAASCIDLDGRDLGTVFHTVFKQNVLESLEVTKGVL